MSKRKAILITIVVLIIGILSATGSYAYWKWTSSDNKSIIFNTSDDLREYIEYDSGEGNFVGDFQASNSYLTGSIHTTIGIKKSQEVANVDLIATIMMDINAIGTNMRQSRALKWVVTSGNADNPGNILSQGNFVGTNAGDTLTLLPNITVTTTKQEFTIWIWLDLNEHPSDALAGETLDTNVWTQIDQVEAINDTFEITRISAHYQVISATAVNSKNTITDYAVVKSSSSEPSSWTAIPAQDQSNVYNLTYAATEGTGTYYVWFRDSEGNKVSRSVQVTQTDSTAPNCTYGVWDPASIKSGSTATITLTCTDAESGISNHRVNESDKTKSNNYINI